ncbi:YfiR/HmsC family protein [Aliidiomarina iranensis]|nr:YfiR/HmsC family protein [Aliidiomarina iranensis]
MMRRFLLIPVLLFNLVAISVFAISALALTFSGSVQAQARAIDDSVLTAPNAEITSAELRAAYLSNVPQYVVWPNESVRQQLTIGVLGNEAVYNQLISSPILPVRGLRIDVELLTRPSMASDVDILYIAPGASHQLNSAFNATRSRPILVVSEHSPVREEMMINLVSGAENRLAFQVNNERIQDSGLRSTLDLLTLRGNELELAVYARRAYQRLAELQTEYTELEDALTATQEENSQLLNRIQILEQTIRERDNVLRAQQGTLEDREQVMESQQSALRDLLTELDQQRQQILLREEQLRQIQQTLRQSESLLAAQQQELNEKEEQLRQKQVDSDELAERITANRNVLAVQQQQLRDQRNALDEQMALLESRERTIDRQRLYLWAIGAAFLIALILAFTTVVMFLNKRKTAGKLMFALDELHEAQDKLVESEKMAALGNLVAGVAHEVNTPLGVAITGTSMVNDRITVLKENLGQGNLTREQLSNFLERSSESLSLTQKNLSRVGALISNFKQIAVDQMVAEQREIDLGGYLEEVMSTLSIELRRAGIRYEIDIPKEIRMITIPGAMAQIITNLVTNSIRHAFTEPGGMLHLEAESVEGNQVRLQFSDNGAGMNNATLTQVFDPFFTTKRNEGGTGLGMSIVYNLVRQKLRGDISVKSELGKGTTFILRLPKNL